MLVVTFIARSSVLTVLSLLLKDRRPHGRSPIRRYGRERRRSRPKAHDVGTIDGMSSTNRRVIPTADSRLREKSRKPHDPRRIPTPFLDAKLALQRNMAARRARLELSQRALAELSGVNLAYLTQLETGHRNPSLLILGRLALALDTDIASLLRTARAAMQPVPLSDIRRADANPVRKAGPTWVTLPGESGKSFVSRALDIVDAATELVSNSVET